jgi:hypothetical protein
MILFLVLTVATIASILCVVSSFAGQGIIAGNTIIFLLFLLFTSRAPALSWIMFGVVMMFSLVGLALNATTKN